MTRAHSPRANGNAPAGQARVRLRTRAPTGEPGAAFGLTAGQPVARWEAGTADGLIDLLPEAQDACRRLGQAALLVGLLPYPDQPPAADCPPTLLLFDHHHALTADRLHAGLAATTPFRLDAPFTADWTAEGYQEGVRRVLDYLAAGDAYQVNLAQRFSSTCTGDPAEAWAALDQRYAPPFSAFVDLGPCQLLSLSPESFLEVAGARVVTRPIKGTRRRGTSEAEDIRLAEELVAHPKDRAENLMIVDLLRNDLGKVCETGSVRTPALFRLESHANVHHLVSTVEGRLKDPADLRGLLAACFPGGSITGAPKRRAMEIIRELEPHPREAYCGSVFWATADGRFGSNITIRSFLVSGGRIRGWAGAGIVADSVPAEEQRECIHKLGPLLAALEQWFL